MFEINHRFCHKNLIGDKIKKKNNHNLPGNDLIVHLMDCVSGSYLQWPIVVLNLGESASLGTGMIISTLLAVDLRLNWDLALTINSIRECACRSITLSIQIKGFTCK